MKLQESLARSRTAHGAWCALPDPFTTELLAREPFDYVCLDAQHGMITEADLPMLLRAAQPSDGTVLVRIRDSSPSGIGWVLDAGADGVIVPMVNSAEQAAAIVRACRYPPEGDRSFVSLGLGRSANRSAAEANADVLCFAMIETPEAVENLASIASTPGISGIYIGPSDLALSHGMTPTFRIRESKHRALVEHVLETCQGVGTAVGLHCPDVVEAEQWETAGFSLLTVASDLALFRSALTGAVEHLTARTGDDG